MIELLPERVSQRPRAFLGHRLMTRNQILAEARLPTTSSFSLGIAATVYAFLFYAGIAMPSLNEWHLA
jgi:hypothetical protein